MNIFIGVLFLIFCSVSGYFLSNKYVKKRKFYQDFSEFNKNLINGISFGKSSLKKILNTTNSKNNSSDFYKYVNEYIDNYDYRFDDNYLSEEEKTFFNDYLSSIGMNDRRTELNSLNSSAKVIEEKLLNAKEDEKKYRKLYIKLGFLIGAVFFIALL